MLFGSPEPYRYVRRTQLDTHQLTNVEQILKHAHLPAQASLRKWLLERTAHQALGGFGKHAGDLPDLYHSYLGLATLGLTGDKDVKELDPTMCISRDAKERLVEIWKRWDVIK